MPHFEIKSSIEINCGIEKEYCDRYPKGCSACIEARLKDLGLAVEQNPKIVELDSEDKQVEIEADALLQKLIDLRNIKQIIIIINGLEILNQHVSGTEIDINLLTGFIQANLSFSEAEEDKSESDYYAIDLGHNYEFQYKDFDVFLRKVKVLNVCLVLEKKASEPLKKLTEIFADEIKKTYRDKIEAFVETGRKNFDGLKESVLRTYNIHLLSPMVMSHSISLDLLRDKKKKRILGPILNEIEDTLSVEPFFYINGLLAKVKAIVNFEPRFIFQEIFQLIEEGIIIPTTIEKIENKIVISEEMRINTFSRSTSSLSSSLMKSEEVEDVIETIDTMNKTTAGTQMEDFIISGKAAEEEKNYDIARKDFKKALILAKRFNFQSAWGRIAYMITEVDRKALHLILDLELEAAEKAEKEKNYEKSIDHYQIAFNIIEVHLEGDFEDTESRLIKIIKKIDKLQKNL